MQPLKTLFLLALVVPSFNLSAAPSESQKTAAQAFFLNHYKGELTALYYDYYVAYTDLMTAHERFLDASKNRLGMKDSAATTLSQVQSSYDTILAAAKAWSSVFENSSQDISFVELPVVASMASNLAALEQEVSQRIEDLGLELHSSDSGPAQILQVAP